MLDVVGTLVGVGLSAIPVFFGAPAWATFAIGVAGGVVVDSFISGLKNKIYGS